MKHQEDSKPLLREECSDDEVVTLPDQKSPPAHSPVFQFITASLLSIIDISAALSTVSKSIRKLHSFAVQNPTFQLAVVAVAVTAILVSMFLGWNLVSAYGEIDQLKRHINEQNETLYFCRNDNSSNTRITETDSGIHTTVEGFTNSTKETSKVKENLTLSINSVIAVVAALLIVCIMITCVGRCFCD